MNEIRLDFDLILKLGLFLFLFCLVFASVGTDKKSYINILIFAILII